MALVGAAVSVSGGDRSDEIAGGHGDWLRRDRQRAALQATWAEWFGQYDALLDAVMCTTAFPHLQDDDIWSRKLTIDGVDRPYINATFWTGMFGVLGLPVAVPPVGRTADGLPGRDAGRRAVPPRPRRHRARRADRRRRRRLRRAAGLLNGSLERSL